MIPFKPTWMEKPYWKRYRKILNIQFWMYRHLVWPKLPLLNVVWAFWTCLFDEGVYNTCKPRYGAMTFSFLNDGCKPTIWHTLQQIFFPHGKYSGIWCPKGAPKSKADAEKKLQEFAEERKKRSARQQ